MKYKEGIDFVFATYAMRLPWMREYTKMLVKSIDKYTTNIPYKIYIVYNYVTDECAENKSSRYMSNGAFNEVLKKQGDGKSERQALQELFGDNENVILVEGVNQSETVVIEDNGKFHQDSGLFPGKIDECPVRAPSKYHSEGLSIGAKVGTQKYVCYLDPDCVFVNNWTDEILPLLDEYFFVSNRWDPGTMFWDCKKPQPRKDVKLTESELGRACPQFLIMKRSDCEENDLWVNIDYRDVGANLTWFAQPNKLDFLCLKNTYWYSHWKTHKGVSFSDIEEHILHPKHNVLKIKNEGYPHEEAFLPSGKCFWVHNLKHGARPKNQNDSWLDAVREQLEL